MVKVNIIFYSMYGHVYRMAEAVAAGAREVEGAEVGIYQVPETLPEEVLEKMGAIETKKLFAHIPVLTREMNEEVLAGADALIFGTPTRYGNMTAQMRAVLDGLGGLWNRDAFVGKVGSVFTSSGTQHGGQESTILTFHVTLLHLGMILVGLPYSEKRQTRMDEITGGSPYGVSTIAGGDGSRQPSENELAMARYQGRHVTLIAKKIAGK
ncbi:TPA: NAD(P)H:quinone oxidoreductase [Methanosarcina acetivorans]|uniref:NAD(P)H dehydrogenase (quinone) n=2 Tax=Methanosarcina acetivorans TaxID=2214 RepID=NQOR_METAC|nr:NAD(P)H:quinone oxidoreductase type IV [Methanosarcina acetivorans]P58796.1 RecName: Full=NAD(P)H dehydrogenase (quinone); AltName: Full=Flavoprotein WrbA; AltName: Full=NAD(P)H:quinone oxidoreductase; Short=NQO [Methanosarcina acetivorans C2A]AAM04610.1 Trp repressor binding protein [Methanosarcina acetivorans C2A]HIH94920.1 NAD(P)H:quinone oxidoreductase [Methanosarcina acetivorans]